MKQHFRRIITLLAIAIFAIPFVHAGVGEKMVVAIETDSFELTETDIASLAVGEARTIETDSGQVVDILRTADGAEVYIDGELVDPGLGIGEGDHEVHVLHKQVNITCNDDEGAECQKHMVIETHGDGKVHKVIVIKSGEETGG